MFVLFVIVKIAFFWENVLDGMYLLNGDLFFSESFEILYKFVLLFSFIFDRIGVGKGFSSFLFHISISSSGEVVSLVIYTM